MTKIEIRQELTARGIDFSADSTKQELADMLIEINKQVVDPVEESYPEVPVADEIGSESINAPAQANLSQCLAMLGGKKIDGSDYTK